VALAITWLQSEFGFTLLWPFIALAPAVRHISFLWTIPWTQSSKSNVCSVQVTPLCGMYFMISVSKRTRQMKITSRMLNLL
jgi:hypothetical protein